jgi:hypothetical protein
VAKCESRLVVKPSRKRQLAVTLRGDSGVILAQELRPRRKEGETGALSWGLQRPRVKVDFHGFHTGNEDDHPNAEPGNYQKTIAIG